MTAPQICACQIVEGFVDGWHISAPHICGFDPVYGTITEATHGYYCEDCFENCAIHACSECGDHTHADLCVLCESEQANHSGWLAGMAVTFQTVSDFVGHHGWILSQGGSMYTGGDGDELMVVHPDVNWSDPPWSFWLTTNLKKGVVALGENTHPAPIIKEADPEFEKLLAEEEAIEKYAAVREIPADQPSDFAEGKTGHYTFTELGKEAYEYGRGKVSLPIDWYDQFQAMNKALGLVVSHKRIRDKLTKYDPQALGQLDATFVNTDAVVPKPSKTAMTKKHFEELAAAIAGLPTTKKNRSAIALSCIPVLRQTNTNFDPYRFMEAATS